jgi:phosphoadenosine phosphosulfate reductase
MSLFENPQTESLDAAGLIRQVLDEAAGKACFTCSFQAEDVVVLDHLRRREPRIPVLFLDTGYHFAETYAYRARLESLWNLNVVDLRPELTVADQENRFGILYQSDPTRCCQMRKVEPLMRGLAPYDVWFTGLRREQSPTRANLRTIEPHVLPGGKTLWKVSPLAHWTWKEVWSYLAANDIEPLPLYDRGYTSVGCEPCTSLPADAANPRSGRWGGRKLECGIHTFTKPR